jgi:uncharacterized protein YlzI (FlbEa/FlbD family)
MLIVTEKLDGRKNMVNESSITNIEDCGNYSTIYFIGGGKLTVKESWSDIQASLNSTATTTATSSETSTVINTNVPSPGRVLLDVQSLIQEEFKYDSDTEKDVKLVNDSVYLIFSKYSSSRLRMAANIRDGKPVLEGTKGNGWAYYARISAGQLIESDGEDVPGTREDKIRNVLNKLFELYK